MIVCVCVCVYVRVCVCVWSYRNYGNHGENSNQNLPVCFRGAQFPLPAASAPCHSLRPNAGSKQLVNELLGGRSSDYWSPGHLPSNGVDKGWSGAIEMLPSSDYARERFVEGEPR